MAEQQSHQSDPRVLNERSLERDHAALASLLAPGLSVLDIGCGTGAITAGILRAVRPGGRVTGVDRDGSLLAAARAAHPDVTFVEADVVEGLPFENEFDIVNAARTLQWTADPLAAVRCMVRAARADGGLVIALDYDHELNRWNPEPPPGFRDFWRAFLNWRTANGWSNRMGSHLETMFREAGLSQITGCDAHEVSGAGDARIAIWTHVIDSLGPRMQQAGFAFDASEAAGAYREWMADPAALQTLSLRAVWGVKGSRERRA